VFHRQFWKIEKSHNIQSMRHCQSNLEVSTGLHPKQSISIMYIGLYLPLKLEWNKSKTTIRWCKAGGDTNCRGLGENNVKWVAVVENGHARLACKPMI
jgi:hypothetical protein